MKRDYIIFVISISKLYVTSRPTITCKVKIKAKKVYFIYIHFSIFQLNYITKLYFSSELNKHLDIKN